MPKAKANRGRPKKAAPAKKKVDSDTTMIDTDCIVHDVDGIIPSKGGIDEDTASSTTNPQKRAKLAHKSDEGVKEVPEKHVTINMRLLEPDLNISYVDKFIKWKKEQAKKHPAPEKPKRAKWTYKGPKPLNDPTNLPSGWTWDEPDLEKLDIEAQIKRCKERIAEQIMPTYFEGRLKGYQAEKDIRDEMASSEKGTYSWDVLQRIDSLKTMEKWFETEQDEYNQLPNVKALLEAYRSRKLDWYGGLVTYWSHGRQLCEPRPHCWHEFEAINRKHKGWESFWVEGYNDEPGPKPIHVARQTFPPDRFGYFWYTAGVRLCNLIGLDAIQPEGVKVASEHSNLDPYFTGPGGADPNTGQPWSTVTPTAFHPWWCDFEFLHDTGSSSLLLYQGDLVTLMGDYRAPEVFYPLCTGSTPIITIGGGYRVRNCIMVQVCLLVPPTPTQDAGVIQRMTEWVSTVATIEPGNYIPGRTARVDDHFLRRTLYQATQPDLTQHLRLSTTKGGLRLDSELDGQDLGNFRPGSGPFDPDAPWFDEGILPAAIPAVKAPPIQIGR